MKKIIAIALALVMVFAMANVALAFEASDYTLGANSTTPARALSKRLTVRPYKAGSTTAIASHAYTFTISQVSGGHDYTTLYSSLDVYANTNGGGASLTGYWSF